ncbi:helix-turn-helix domain-containing protein [Loigolactobacillus binensis]|uniref:Helix-turn-helix domain-containing protein n=1 Tax=Loigolactobacillus binensis TaxID=2559922 RepID=A0ABW3E875_9LACO|nr:helix-turn-helix domain-containing protein [Loigolactobacillus binensis]
MSEIGQKLRDARIDKGYTLDDLQQITKIQKRYLIAIEEGNFEALPGDFYVRAFVKQYADTVGLDSEQLLNEFNDTIPQPQPQEYIEPDEEDKKTATRTRTKDHDTSFARFSRYLPTIIIVAVVVIIVGVIYAFAIGNRERNKSVIQDSSSVTVSSVSSSKKKASSASSSSQASSSSTAKKASSTKKTSTKPKMTVTAETTTSAAFTYSNAPTANTLVLHAGDTKTAWVSVTAGGTQVWQGTLTSAEQSIKIPTGTTSFTIQTGNAENTKAKMNGKTFNLDPNNVGGYVKTITVTMTTAAAASSSSATSTSSQAATTASSQTTATSSSQAVAQTTTTN